MTNVHNLNQVYHYTHRNGVATIPASDITTMILKNPNQPTECDDRTKQDFECLMADQISGDVYLVQKNVFGTDVSLYKVSVSAINLGFFQELFTELDYANIVQSNCI